MLIGGFQNVEMPKLGLPVPEDARMPLPCDTNGLYSRQVFTNNGRTATIYLLRHGMKFEEDDVLLLPDYLCLSIIVSIEEPKVKYRFYHISRDLSIDLDSLRAQLDEHVKGIYIIHYFGVPFGRETVEALLEIRARRSISIVEDITQALLSRDGARMGFGDYLVASTRKWLPMTDGGILAARDGAPLELVALADPYNEAAYKQLLITLIRERYDANPALDRRRYLDWEAEANRVRYTDLTVRGMTGFARSVLFHADWRRIMRRRRANYQVLSTLLREIDGIAILSKPMDDAGEYVPFGLVVLAEERDALFRYLTGRGIVGEIQWALPLEYYQPGADARYLSDHNLMLHCDQRYTEREMRLVADAVRDFFQEGRAK